MKIKVNGVTISVESSPVTSGNLALNDLDKQSIMLSKESEDITKMIKMYNIMSNVKAVESFGYKSTEGVGEKIKEAAKAVWEKIRDFFIKIGKFIADVFTNGALKIRASSLLKKVKLIDEKDIIFDIEIDSKRLFAKSMFKPLPISEIARLISGYLHNIRSERIYDKMKPYLNSDNLDSDVVEDIGDNIEQLEDSYDKLLDKLCVSSQYDSNRKYRPLSHNDFNSKTKIINYLESIISGNDEISKIAIEIRKEIDSSVADVKLLCDKSNTGSSLQGKIESLAQKYFTHCSKSFNDLTRLIVFYHNINLTGIRMGIGLA